MWREFFLQTVMNSEKIDIADQFDLIDKYENRTMVKHVLEEDLKFLKFITTFVGTTTKWSYVINDGVISNVPLCYYYFVGYKYIPTTGKRIIRVGFICWPRKIYATIDIDFNVYPRKSVYVNPHKAWCLPHTDVTFNMKIIYPVNSFDESITRAYVHSCALALMSVTRICVKYNVSDLRSAYFRGISSYPSYRLANLLVYNQKLVLRVRDFMVLNCNCSFKTSANIPYCGCETLCSEIIPKNFADAGRMCSSDVLFCATRQRDGSENI
jgi:hypothetical protein